LSCDPFNSVIPILNDIVRGLLGVLCLLAIAYALSAHRRHIKWRIVAGGLLVQLILAFVFFLGAGASSFFQGIANLFVTTINFTGLGAEVLFGPVLTNPAEAEKVLGIGRGFIFAFQVLPTIIFFSALTSLLYYLGALQRIVYVMAWVMKRFMRLSGAESLAAAANVFVGQTEAPLVVKPYIPSMTRSEIMALMTGGMATIAGGVLVAYIGILGGTDEQQQQEFAKFLLCASLMNAPAALLMAKILVPETNSIEEGLIVPKDSVGSNVLDAIANGTSQGLKLALNVAAMIVAFVALIALLNALLSDGIGGFYVDGSGVHFDREKGWMNLLVQQISGGDDAVFKVFSLEAICGFLFSPIAAMIGVESGDLLLAGSLLGKKIIINEFVAYLDLGLFIEAKALSAKSAFLLTFALCGFANFSSIGIQLGGIGTLAPTQRPALAELGLKAMIGGTLASLLTASIAGMFFQSI
jgi:CNT family concentrative nucleoside transporter